MAKMKWFDWIAFWLITVGALNWGIYGLTRLLGKSFDLVTWLGEVTSMTLANIVFVVIGFFGLLGVITGIKLSIK